METKGAVQLQIHNETPTQLVPTLHKGLGMTWACNLEWIKLSVLWQSQEQGLKHNNQPFQQKKKLKINFC
jgi:hypothetical protein